MRDADATVTDNEPRRPPAIVPVLIQVYPVFSGKELPRWVIDRPITIGRSVDPDRDLCLQDDTKTSKRHAVIVPDADAATLTDLASKNHTFVDGRAVKTTRLRDGSVIRVGGTLFVLRFERQGEADAPKSAENLHRRLRGRSQEIKKLRHEIFTIAQTEQPVLLVGPTGVGKELAARSIHELSPRRAGAFVAANCAAIPVGAEESTLFGHDKGSFTGAERSHAGYFRMAQGGTLFLDELGELAPCVQAKVLRALEPIESDIAGAKKPTLFRVPSYGGQSESLVDIRIVTATNVKLRSAVSSGTFREDLYHRLSVLPIHLPALKSRRDDILGLFHHFLSENETGIVRRASVRLAELLLLHSWSGNVRELRNLASQLVAKNAPSVLEIEDLSEDALASIATIEQRSPSDENADDDEQLNRITKEILERLLHENDGKISVVARLLGRSARQIRRRMDEFKLSRPKKQPKSGNDKTDGNVGNTLGDDDNENDDKKDYNDADGE